jgi:hypothetical protein
MPNREELEFSFWGLRARATGRFPIIVLAFLLIPAMATAFWIALSHML